MSPSPPVRTAPKPPFGVCCRHLPGADPDAEGLHLWNDLSGATVGFGHRRLAILDLSPAGAQPMLSADGRVGIVFNGCIYNFHDIRHELEQKGHTFRSQCDTEILIEGYREWGSTACCPACAACSPWPSGMNPAACSRWRATALA